ncbi:MAG: ABC transporter permease, partial [Promethearchaeota archaeon]
SVYIRKDIHGFTVIRVAFDPVIWIGGSLVGLFVIISFSFLSIIPIIRLTPREAMVTPYSKTELGQEPFLERLLGRIGLFNKIIPKIPLRTVFMNKKRSLSTVITVAVSMIILVASVTMVFDLIYAVDKNYSDYEKFDVNVVLQQPASEKVIKNWINENISQIGDVEGYIFTEVFVSSDRVKSSRVPLQAFHRNSTLRKYNIISGNINSKSELSKNSIAVGSTLSEDLGVKPGDELVVTFDENNTFTLKVAGITGELYDTALLWTIESLQERTSDVQNIGITENVTAFVFDFTENSLSDAQKLAIKKQIDNKFHPYLYYETDEVLDTITAAFEAFSALLVVIGLLGLGIMALFSFSSMSLAMMDREMEFLALRAMGAQRRSILKVIHVENLLYGIFGLILGVPISLALLRPAFNFLYPEIYIPILVPVQLWLVVVSLILFSVFLSTSLLAWKTWRSSLHDMLRNRMTS